MAQNTKRPKKYKYIDVFNKWKKVNRLTEYSSIAKSRMMLTRTWVDHESGDHDSPPGNSQLIDNILNKPLRPASADTIAISMPGGDATAFYCPFFVLELVKPRTRCATKTSKKLG
jgi:hypothetical protein